MTSRDNSPRTVGDDSMSVVSRDDRSFRSRASKLSKLSKTANEVTIKDLNNEDLHEVHVKFKQDEFNRQDMEVKQFEKPSRTTKYVESMISGKFTEVKKDFDPNADRNLEIGGADADGNNIISTQELNDYEMKMQQGIWVNRIHKTYNTVLGLLGGMGVMHIIFVAAHSDNNKFHDTYADSANLICIITQVLTNMSLVFGLSLTLIYKNISDEKQRNLDLDRLVFKEHYVLSLVTQFFIFMAWIMLNI